MIRDIDPTDANAMLDEVERLEKQVRDYQILVGEHAKISEAQQEVIRDMDKSAEAGLCYFTLGSVREFLKDIRRKAKEAGLQGGLTEFHE